MRKMKKAFTEAIRSIWLRRVMPLCDKVSCLVTRDLLSSCRRLWTAHNNEKACKRLMDENTRVKALISLRKVVSELNPNIDVSEEIESSEESEETVPMVEARETDINQNTKASEAMDEDQDTELKKPTSGEPKAKPLLRKIKTISSAVVDRALKKLRASKMELVNALKEGDPSYLNNETIAEEENDVAGPSATSIAQTLSLMERRSTPVTYEWTDSIDDSDGERNNKSKHKRIVVPPLKRNRSPEGAGRKKVPWSTAETLAVLRGYEKYGAKWKLIKDVYPVLDRRTNGDIKDKFRVEMRREEHRP